MKNKTTSELKKMSNNTLEERLDALCSIIAKLQDYQHVFEVDEKLHTLAQDEINDIINELELREQ